MQKRFWVCILAVRVWAQNFDLPVASSLDLGWDNQIGEAAGTQPNPFWWWAVVALSRSQRQHFNNMFSDKGASCHG